MRSPVVFLALATLGAALGPAEAAPRRRGKVVRVTRVEPTITTRVRMCQLYDIDAGGCSREVKVGDVGWVLDAEGMYGQATVLEVNPVADACGTTVTWNIQIDMSQLTGKDYSYNAVLVLDHDVADQGRLLPTSLEAPGGRPGELVVHVLDDDGDGNGDVLISTFACDDRAQAAASQPASHQCLDYWVERRDEWRRARTDVVPTCQR